MQTIFSRKKRRRAKWSKIKIKSQATSVFAMKRKWKSSYRNSRKASIGVSLLESKNKFKLKLSQSQRIRQVRNREAEHPLLKRKRNR